MLLSQVNSKGPDFKVTVQEKNSNPEQVCPEAWPLKRKWSPFCVFLKNVKGADFIMFIVPVQ